VRREKLHVAERKAAIQTSTISTTQAGQLPMVVGRHPHAGLERSPWTCHRGAPLQLCCAKQSRLRHWTVWAMHVSRETLRSGSSRDACGPNAWSCDSDSFQSAVRHTAGGRRPRLAATNEERMILRGAARQKTSWRRCVCQCAASATGAAAETCTASGGGGHRATQTGGSSPPAGDILPTAAIAVDTQAVRDCQHFLLASSIAERYCCHRYPICGAVSALFAPDAYLRTCLRRAAPPRLNSRDGPVRSSNCIVPYSPSDTRGRHSSHVALCPRDAMLLGRAPNGAAKPRSLQRVLCKMNDLQFIVS